MLKRGEKSGGNRPGGDVRGSMSRGVMSGEMSVGRCPGGEMFGGKCPRLDYFGWDDSISDRGQHFQHSTSGYTTILIMLKEEH